VIFKYLKIIYTHQKSCVNSEKGTKYHQSTWCRCLM